MSLVLSSYLVFQICEDLLRQKNNIMRRENKFSEKQPNFHLIVLYILILFIDTDKRTEGQRYIYIILTVTHWVPPDPGAGKKLYVTG